MKIAVVHNVPAGGAKRALYSFGKYLHQRGHTIDLFTTTAHDDGLFSLSTFANKTVKYELKKISPLGNVRPYFIKVYLNLFQKIIFLRQLNILYKKIAAEVDTGAYDIVFVHNCVTQAPFLLQHLNSLTVYYAHEPLRSAYEPDIDIPDQPDSLLSKIKFLLPEPAIRLQRYITKTADRKNILSAQYVFSNSYYTRESLYKAYGILATVSYPGVDIDSFRPLDLPRKNFVLSIGSIAPIKKHDFVIDSLARINKDIRPNLIIIGNFTSKNYMDNLLERAKSKDVTVELKLLISDEELLKLYNEAKMVIYPPVMEPFGLVPLEAMACGTPVIGVKEGGIRETIVDGETGLLINRDEDQCAQAIEKLLRDDNLSKELGRKGREYVCQKWNWEKCTEQLEENFKRILAQNKKGKSIT